MPPKQPPPRPSLRTFLADEMSTSRGKRLLLQKTLAVGADAFGPPEMKQSPLVKELDALTSAGVRARLSRFLITQSPELELLVKGGDQAAARALLRAWEQVANDEVNAEHAIAWAGRLGKDKSLIELLSVVAAPGKPKPEQAQALKDRVLTAIIAPAVPMMERAIEARFAGQKTAVAKRAGALARIFRDFDSRSAFAEAAKLKPK